MTPSFFVTTAEAAYLAGLTDQQINQVVDKRLIPEALIERRNHNRTLTRLGAAFAKFYFATEDLLVADARRRILDELIARIERLETKDEVFTLRMLNFMNWKVESNFVEVDVLPFVQLAFYRAEEVDQSKALVSTDPEIMDAVPVFAGSRVPIETVLDSLLAGSHLDRLKVSYPFLTESHIQCAKVYEEVHPRRPTTTRIAEVNPELVRRVKLVSA
jgi:uncharacterized protein (DUF433 family)